MTNCWAVYFDLLPEHLTRHTVKVSPQREIKVKSNCTCRYGFRFHFFYCPVLKYILLNVRNFLRSIVILTSIYITTSSCLCRAIYNVYSFALFEGSNLPPILQNPQPHNKFHLQHWCTFYPLTPLYSDDSLRNLFEHRYDTTYTILLVRMYQ